MRARGSAPVMAVFCGVLACSGGRANGGSVHCLHPLHRVRAQARARPWQLPVTLRGGLDSLQEIPSSADAVSMSRAETTDEPEPSCSEALHRMEVLTQAAREERCELVDAYALLKDLEDEGLPVDTEVFNEFLRLVVELARRGAASTVSRLQLPRAGVHVQFHGSCSHMRIDGRWACNGRSMASASWSGSRRRGSKRMQRRFCR